MMSEVIKALVKARKDIGAAKKDTVNLFFKSKYADLGAIMEAVKEPLEAHGLAFVQDIAEGAVVTVIMHESGETLRLAPFPIVASKQDAQGHGSALTYARRYSLQTALGVPSEDDDGNAASRPAKKFAPPIESAQGTPDVSKVDAVVAALEGFGADEAQGEDRSWQYHETVSTLEADDKIAVWARLPSGIRARIKRIEADFKAAKQ
jgi:hypothetical protein